MDVPDTAIVADTAVSSTPDAEPGEDASEPSPSSNAGDDRRARSGVGPDTWTTAEKSAESDRGGVGTIRDIRIATHESYDRIVLEFAEDVHPGYSVNYLDDDVIECGSGEPIELAGSAALEIRISPARGHTDAGRSTVDHGDRSPNLPAVKETAVTCDFEAVFALTVGTSGRRPFRVQAFGDPARLVVDIQQ